METVHPHRAPAPSPTTETMQVAVRVRPLSPNEQARGDAVAIQTPNDTTLTLASTAASQQQRTFAFDRVFDSTTSNDDVYRGAVQHLVHSAMHGFNACVFAYGQTASGKTHTIKAVTQAAAADIFAHVAASPDREWLIRASAIEIYNEEARDMLRDEGGQEPLKPRPDKKRGTVFEGLHDEGVHSAQHLLRLLKGVYFRRQVRETKMNECSSRSHLVVRLHIESRPVDPSSTDTSTPTAASTPTNYDLIPASHDVRPVLVAVLDFVDLAGAEQVGKEASREGAGDRQRHVEGVRINTSLHVLGKVVRALGEKESHIPYRESKLTRLLQLSLGGNARTTMICTLSPSAVHLHESASALHFASAATRVIQQPQVNEIQGEGAQLKRLQSEIKALRQQLESAHMLQENAQLNQQLKAKEEQIRLTATHAEVATRKLRTLERLILRGNPSGGNKVRASWSPALPTDTPPKGGPRSIMSSNGAGTRGPSLSASWNPVRSGMGGPGQRLPGQAQGTTKPTDHLFLDLLKPTAPPKPPTSASTILARRTPTPPAEPSTPATPATPPPPSHLPPPQAADAAATQEALEALRAQVTCIQLGSQPTTGEGLEDTIARLQEKLKGLLGTRAVGLVQETQKQQQVAAVQAELRRLQEEHEVQVAAQVALDSLEQKLHSIRTSQDGDDEDVDAAGDADADPSQWLQGSPMLTPSSSVAATPPVGMVGLGDMAVDMGGNGGGNGGGVGKEESPHSSLPNMDSPVCDPSTINGKRSPMGSFLRITPGTGGVQGENTTPFMRSYSDRPTGTPHTDAMTSWYKNKLRAIKEAFKESTERDIGALRGALEQYKVHVERLDCQKQLLLKQVLHLEVKLEERQKAYDDLALQLLAAKKALAEQQPPCAGEGPPGAPPAPPLAVPALSSPMPSPMRGGEVSSSTAHTDWASAPSVETLLFKIVALWDALYVPLIHRSRFYLAFRGRELFYFEAEHRRLSHLKGQLLPGEEESPFTNKQAKKKLESAQRRLEWERKWLMHQLKYEFSEEEREDLFLTWNIHRESKERKGQLLRKVWRFTDTLDHDMMQSSSQLVMRLNGSDAAEGMFDLVFGKTEGDTWVKSLAHTSGALVAPLLQRFKGTPGRQSVQRKSTTGGGLLRQLTPRRHSISAFAGWNKEGEGTPTTQTSTPR